MQPQFPRPPLPTLFSQESPWNQPVVDVVDEIESQRTMCATFDILREFGWTDLATAEGRLLALNQGGASESESASKLAGMVAKKKAALTPQGEIDRGGLTQMPQLVISDFAFPIFSASDQFGNRRFADIPLRTYDAESWEPSYPRRHQTGNTWIAEQVPVPPTRFRPAGPQTIDSDGTLIVFDLTTGEEIDFWQVTSDQQSPGGGREGDTVFHAGAISQFELHGFGARRPEIGEPKESSRASGLPYLGGLLVPEDFGDGVIHTIPHALAFTLPRCRYFPLRVPGDPPDFEPPATRTEYGHFIQHPHALAAGMRIRLKSVIRNWDGRDLAMSEWDSLPAAVAIIFRTLNQNGAYLVDGSAGFGIAAEDVVTAPMDPVVAERITGRPATADDTPWAATLNTINEFLSWKLFPGNEETLHSGLSLATLVGQGKERELWSNFEVATNS